MQIFLIRHPRPRLVNGICYGRLDVDCEDPLPVAKRLRPCIPAGTPIFSSPLQRARRLAEALAEPSGGAPRIETRLREIDFGDWEGKRWDEIDRRALDAWAADVLHFIPPGGESVAQLRTRIVEFAASLDLPRAAIVSHAGVMRALVGYWRAIPVAQWTQIEFPFGGLTVIDA